MEKITKKALKKLHDKNKLFLVGVNKRDKNETLKTLKTDYSEAWNMNTTGMNIEIDKIKNTSAYKHIINNKVFYFLESINDSSKDKNCSWDDISISTVVYILK